MDYLKGSAPIEQLLGTYQPSEGEDQNSNIFGDIGTGLKQGVTTDLAHTVTGLVDLAGSAVGADVSATAAADKAGLADLEKSYYNELTPETKEALRKVEEAEGFWGTLGAYASNPRAIAYDLARALPMSLAGGGLGAAGAKGAAKLAGTATAKNAVKKELLGSTGTKAANYWAAGGEGLVGAGMSASSIAQYNAANPETRDPLEGVGYAALTGFGTGLVAGAAGRIGGSVESAVFNKSIRETMANKPWASVGKSAVTEGLEEAAQAPTETVPQNWAEDKPWNEDLGQNIAQSLIAGSAMGGGAHGAMRALRFASPGDGRPQVSQEPVDVNQAASGATMSMEGATPVQPPMEPTQPYSEAQLNGNIETLAAEIARKRDEAKAKKAAKTAPVIEGTIQQGDQVVPTQAVASAKVAPTQVVPVAATLPGTRRVKPGIDRPAGPDGMEVPTKAELRAAKKKAEAEEMETAKARYEEAFAYPRSEGSPYLARFRENEKKPGYVPAIKALREAEKHLKTGELNSHHKLATAINNISNAAETEEDFAAQAEKTANYFKTSKPARAEVFALASEILRNPGKPVEEVIDTHQRNRAFARYEAANQATPQGLATYDVYDFSADNVKNGPARVKFNFHGKEVTLNGQVRKHKFYPDAKQFDDFATYIEGVRGTHTALHDEVTGMINNGKETPEQLSTDDELKEVQETRRQRRKDEIAEVMGTDSDTTGVSGKQMLARMKSRSTEEEDEGSDKEKAKRDFEVTGDVGQSNSTDEESSVRRFFGKALYARLLNSKANKGADGKRIIELDTNHKENPLRDGALEKIEAAVKSNPDLADEIEAALTGQEGLDALDEIRNIKNVSSAAEKALETLVALARIAKAGNISEASLEHLTDELYSIYTKDTESMNASPSLNASSPTARPSRAGIESIKAQTPIGKAIQKEALFLDIPNAYGVAVQLKTIDKHTKEPEKDLKGLFTDEFIARVFPVLREFREKGYPVDDNMWLVDGSHPVMADVVNGVSVPATPPSRGSFVTFSDRYLGHVYNYGLGGFFTKDFLTTDKLLVCAFTDADESATFFHEHMATHEFVHAFSYETDQENVNGIWRAVRADDASLGELAELMSLSSLDKFHEVLPDYKLRDGELKTFIGFVEYPSIAAKRKQKAALGAGKGKARANRIWRQSLREEMAAVFFSLSRTSDVFKALLATGKFPNIQKAIEDTNNVILAPKTPNARGMQANRSGLLPGDRDGTPNVQAAARPGVGRRVLREDAGMAKNQPQQNVGAGSDDRRGLEARTAGSSRENGKEVPQHRGLTVKTQKLVDRYIAKLPAHIRPFAENLSHKLFTSGLGLFFTRDICNMAYDATGIKAFKKYEETHQKLDDVRNTRLKEISAVLNKSSKFPKKEREVAGEYILDATLNEAWGYAHKSVFKDVGEYIKHVAKLDETHRKAEQTMRKRFNALSKAQQEVVKDYFETGVRELNTQLQLLKEKLDARRMPAVAEAEGKEIDEIEESPELKRIRHDIEHLQKCPYAPLMRAGTHMVIVKSPAYKKAERELEIRSKAFNQMKEKDKEDRKWLKEAKDKLESLKSSPDDYIVEFVNGAGTAREVGDRYRSEIPGADIVVAERIEQLQSEIPGYQQIERWANVLAKNIEDGTVDELSQKHARALANELKKVLGTLYIRSLADNSAKKRQLKRRNVKGFNRDVFQNLAAAAPSSANLLAYTRYSDELADNIREIGTEVKKLRGDDRMTASEFQNELIRRENLTGKQYSDLTNSVMRFTSMWMLLGNPSFYLQNLTQPFMMSAPYMAARHGVGVYAKLGKTCVEVFKLMKSDTDLSKLEKVMNDPKVAPKDKPLTMDEWRALDHARRHGHLDIGITQDFGDAIRSDNKAASVAFGVTEKLTQGARVVEMYNRVATFLVAYRLEKAKGSSEAAAGAYADEVIYQTHGDYSAFNAPRWFGMTGLHRIATQFRKFQLIQAGLMIRLAANSFKGATPEIKAEARKQLLYIMSTYFAATGLKGMPFVFALMPAFALGDEGDDDEDVLRKAIGDKQLADFLVRGIPAGFGLDVSGKVGAENMLSLMPYTDAKFSDGRAGANSLLAGALGPSASLVQRFYTGMQYFAQGDNWKAIEQLTPGIVSNSLKGYRIATEGFTTKAGDQVLKPEDYDFGDAITQALGFQPRVMTDRMRVQDSLIRHKESFDAEKNRIYMDFKKARREGDHAGMNQARREMLKLAAEARKQGLTGYTIQNMINAANEQRRRERQAVGGVGTSKNDRQFVKKMSEI